MCHSGPGSESANPNRAPVASNLNASTAAGVPVTVALKATDADGNALTLRIVSQPANGTVGLSGTTATYYPYAGFAGPDTFTYAAWDGSVDSNLATVTVQVGSGGGTSPCSLTTTASAPSTALAGSAVSFSASATPSNCTGSVAYDWNFGDGSAHAATQTASHVYATAGSFTWTLTASIGGVTSTKSGTIAVSSSSTSGCSLTTAATVPGTGTAGVAVSFTTSATPTNCTGSVAYDWNFGDGTTHGTSATVSHVYASAGTYNWTMRATISGVTSSKTGSIVIASQSLGPSISSVRALYDPFRIQINGANYQTGVKVYIGGSPTAWPYVQRVSSSQLILSGSGLSYRFPVGTRVQIKVVNPDGSYATTTFTRTSN
jgi:PKD repeat protein